MAQLSYELNYGYVPFILDTARVVRIKQEIAPTEDDYKNTIPLKHQPETDIIEEIDRLMAWQYLSDFSLPPTFPGRNLGAIANQNAPDPQPNPEIKLYDLYYPYDASRWSVFRGLATSSMTKAMLEATAGATQPRLLTMMANPISPSNPGNNEANYTISSNMWMLPPRPLAELGGKFDGLYLITLVDGRYLFQGSPVLLHVKQDTTWASLLTELASALSITLTYDLIPAVYGQPEPDSQLWANFENAATLLDAIAYNVGRKVVRNLDDTYSLQSPTASQAIVNANRGNASRVVRTAGGDIFYSGTQLPVGDLTKARNAIVPNDITVTFPKYVRDNDPVPHFMNSRYSNQRPSAWYEESYGDVYAINIPISSGGPLVSGLTGVSTQFIHNTSKALMSGEVATTPLNLSGITSLALQIARDRYESQVASALDESYPGTFLWVPEGIHDVIWTYSAKVRQGKTRVLRGEWNLAFTELQHATIPASGAYTNTPAGVGGPSVAQTIRDSYSGIITNTLGSSLLTGQVTATFTGIDFFPSQNRWKGKIEEENILFEGTSGGTSVDVVLRGVDGSIETDHPNGATIEQIVPDTTYGVNLTTYEKGQWAFPSDTRAGGIAGINVIPQTQTVKVTSSSSTTVNGVNYYPGKLYLYDSSQSEGSPKVSREDIFIVDRNEEIPVEGRYYDGQFAGFSDDVPPVQPIYLISNTGFVFNITEITNVTDYGDVGVAGKSKLDINDSSTKHINNFTGGVKGQLLVVWNTGSFPLILTSLGNILTPLGQAYTLWPNDGVTLEFDGSVWRFDNPSIGAGTNVSTATTYAIRHLKFGTGLTYVDNSDGSALITATGGAGGAGTKDYFYWIPGKAGIGAVGGSPAFSRWAIAGSALYDVLINTPANWRVIYCLPFVTPRGGTVDQVAVHVDIVAAAGGQVAKLALYTNISDTACYPGALIADWGTVDISNLGTQIIDLTVFPNVPQVLTAGSLYWFILWPQYVFSTRVLGDNVAGAIGAYPLLGVIDPTYTVPQVGWKFGNSNVGAGGPYDYNTAVGGAGVLPNPMNDDGDPLLVNDVENLPAIYIHFSA